jgi:hypothetical protein
MSTPAKKLIDYTQRGSPLSQEYCTSQEFERSSSSLSHSADVGMLFILSCTFNKAQLVADTESR